MSKRILLIEDDYEISELLSSLLTREGFSVTEVHDGPTGEERALTVQFDAIILDIMLPGKNGLDVLRDIRHKIKTPILMLTAKGEDIDRIIGFEIGADDYLPKPFNPRELIARINALLRRVSMDTESETQLSDLCIGNITVKTKCHEVYVNERLIDLTTTEYTVLVELMSNLDEIVTKADLTERTLGRKLSLHDRAIDMHVSNLRKKLSEDHIRTVRGVGYLFQSRSSQSGPNHGDDQ